MTVAPKTLDEMTPEELAAEIDRRGTSGPDDTGLAAPEEEREEPAEEPEPEGEETAEEPPAPEEGDPGDEAPEPTPLEAQLADLRRRVEAETLARQAEQERRKHVEFLLSRKAGEAGYLKRQLDSRGASRQDQISDDEPEREHEEAPRDREIGRIAREARAELDDLKRERSERVLREEGERLANQHKAFWETLRKQPEPLQQEFVNQWRERLQSEAEGLGIDDAKAAGDSKQVASIVRASYATALAETRIAFLGRLGTRGRTQTGSQTAGLREKKLAAAAGASGVRRAPAKRRPTSLDELSPDELKAEIDRREREGILIE